jgi:hypothetical protein
LGRKRSIHKANISGIQNPVPKKSFGSSPITRTR